jgi:hypothetical protein
MKEKKKAESHCKEEKKTVFNYFSKSVNKRFISSIKKKVGID